MNKATKGDTIRVNDSDGGTTGAKVISVSEDGSVLEVKWLEPRWNLTANILVARKGTKSRISASSVA